MSYNSSIWNVSSAHVSTLGRSPGWRMMGSAQRGRREFRLAGLDRIGVRPQLPVSCVIGNYPPQIIVLKDERLPLGGSHNLLLSQKRGEQLIETAVDKLDRREIIFRVSLRSCRGTPQIANRTPRKTWRDRHRRDSLGALARRGSRWFGSWFVCSLRRIRFWR
jgi:hypothetical protein